MFIIEKQWKEFSISLDNLEKYLKQNFPYYTGNQATGKLELFFSEELSVEDMQIISDHWESLDGSDYVDATTLISQAIELDTAVADLKLEIVTKTWDQMSVVERKVAVGLKPTREEMGLE